VRVYALVSYKVQSIIDVFPTQEAAEAFIEEVRRDEPDPEMLGVEAIELVGGDWRTSRVSI
jgi:hypothetical protein